MFRILVTSSISGRTWSREKLQCNHAFHHTSISAAKAISASAKLVAVDSKTTQSTGSSVKAPKNPRKPREEKKSVHDNTKSPDLATKSNAGRPKREKELIEKSKASTNKRPTKTLRDKALMRKKRKPPIFDGESASCQQQKWEHVLGYLQASLAGNRKGRATSDTRRMNIVGESLCGKLDV